MPGSYLQTALAALLLGAVLLALSVVALRWIRALRRRQPYRHPLGDEWQATGAASDAGIIIAERGGRLVFINEQARQLFGLNGQTPDLDRLLRLAEPADALLALLAAEGQATLTVGSHRVQAISHCLPLPDRGPEKQAIVLRESDSAVHLGENGSNGAEAVRLVAEFAQAVSSSLELEATVSAILNQLAQILPFHLAEITLWDEANQGLRPVHFAGDQDYPRELALHGDFYRLDEGYSGWLARNRQPLLVQDIRQFMEAQPKLFGPDFSFAAYAGVPLLAGEEFLGTLELASYAAGAYSSADLAILGLVAGPAAQAIRNAQHYSAQQRRLAELSGIAEIMGALELTADPRELHARLAADIARYLNVGLAGFMHYQPGANALVGQPPFFGMPDIVAEVYRIPLRVGSLGESLWRQGRHWLSADVPNDPAIDELGLRQFAETTGLKTTLMVPIALGGRRYGLVQVGNKSGGSPFTAEDVRLLAIFARQAAAILDNARLVRETQARADEAEALRAIAAATAAGTVLDTALRLAMQETARLLHIDLGMVVLLDEARGELVPQPASVIGGPPAEAHAVRLRTDDPFFAVSITRTRRPFLTGRAQRDRRVAGFYRQMVDHYQINSAMVVPLTTGDRSIGEIIVTAFREHAFTRADLRLLGTVAAQLAAAIERARLHEATDQNLQRRVDHLTALTRVSRELNQTLDLERILRLVHDEAIYATRANCGTLVLLDLDAAPGSVALRLGDEALSLHLTALEAQVAAGEQLKQRLRDLAEGSPLAAHPGVRAALVVPILTQGQVVGLMHLHSHEPEGFDEAAEEAAQALAAQTAIAVENARRFRDQVRRGELLRRRADQLGQLFEVSRSVRSDFPLADNLEAIAFGLQEAVGFDEIVISVFDARSRRLKRTAAAGLPLSTFEALSQVEPPWDDAARLLREEYRVSQSYLLPGEQTANLTASVDPVRSVPSETAPAGPNAWRPGDLLLVPLRGSGEQPVGLLSIDSPRDGRRPDRNTIEIIEIFANQAAQAIENATLYEAAERRAAQLLALHRVVEAASAATQNAQVWQTVAEALLAELPGLDLCLVALQPAATSTRPTLLSAAESPAVALTIVGKAGRLSPHLEFGPLLAAKHPLGQALAERGPVLVLNVADSEWAFSPLVAALEVGSFVCVPVISQGEPAGALFVGAQHRPEQPSPFLPEDLDVFTVLANQLGANLESFQLEADIQLRAAQLAALAEVSQTITATLRTEDVVQAVLSGLPRVMPHDSVTLWLREGKQLRIIAAQGFENNAERVGLRVDIADSVFFAEMERTLAPILVPEVRADPRFAAGEFQPTQSWLAAPLISQGQILGVLALDKTEAHYYGPQAMQVLMAFANQAAVALDNARLFEESQQRAGELDERSQRLALLNRVSAQLSGTLHESQIYAITLTEIMRALAVDRAVMVAVDEFGRYRLALEQPDSSEPTKPAAALALPALERVTVTGAPLAIEDVQRDTLLSDVRAPLAAGGVHSLLVVPLAVGGQVLAVLQAEQLGVARRFTTGEIELAQTLANQAAVAAQNARLYAQTERRVAELATINRLSLALAAQRDVKTLVALVGEQLQQIFAMPVAYVALYDQPAGQIEFPYWVEYGEIRRFDPLPFGQGLTSYVIGTRQPLVVNSNAERRLAELGAVATGGRPLKSFLVVPMVVGEDVIGVLSVQTAEREGAFSEGDVSLLSTIAANVGVAIQSARLFAQTQSALAERTRAEQELRRRNEELEALNRVGAAVTAEHDLHAMLRATAREIVQIFAARNSGIALLNPERTHLTVIADYSARADDPPAEGVVIPLEGNLSSQQVIETGHSLVLARAYEHPLTAPIHELLRERHTECLLIVPLRVRGDVIGTIGLDTDQPNRVFSPGEVALVETIAGQIAGAVENARFAQELEARVAVRTRELERERQRVEILLQVTTELSSSLDLDRVLARALQLVAEAVGADRGSVYLLDLETNQLIYRAALGAARALPPGGLPAPFKRNESLVGWVIKHRQAVLIGDLTQDPRWVPLPDHEGDHRSALVVPLMTNEEALGAMVMLGPEPNAFAEDQLRLVAAAANQVGAAINNAELYRLIRDQAERLGGMLRAQQVEATKSRAILEGIADGVIVADGAGNVSLINMACERILGLDRNSVVGRPVTEFMGIYGPAGKSWVEAVDRWSRDPNSYRPGEFVAQRITLDQQKVIAVHLAPVIAGDEYLGSVSVIRDITRDVEVDRLKSEFVTNVSHELRTPMTSIKGYADLMLMGAAGPLQPNQARFLEVIKGNADRLSLLVNDLLDISRIESGRVQLVMRPTLIGEVIQDVVATLRGRSDEESKPMTLTVAADPNLPPVWGDRERITQMLMNVADNAFSYSHPGGTITIRAQLDKANHQVVVEVTDSGVGIPIEDQPRLFDRFYRGEDALVLATAGTGLGLSIARQLAEMHGGRLWLAHSEPGRGSSFALALPLAGEGRAAAG